MVQLLLRNLNHGCYHWVVWQVPNSLFSIIYQYPTISCLPDAARYMTGHRSACWIIDEGDGKVEAVVSHLPCYYLIGYLIQLFLLCELWGLHTIFHLAAVHFLSIYIRKLWSYQISATTTHNFCIYRWRLHLLNILLVSIFSLFTPGNPIISNTCNSNSSEFSHFSVSSSSLSVWSVCWIIDGGRFVTHPAHPQYGVVSQF